MILKGVKLDFVPSWHDRGQSIAIIDHYGQISSCFLSGVTSYLVALINGGKLYVITDKSL